MKDDGLTLMRGVRAVTRLQRRAEEIAALLRKRDTVVRRKEEHRAFQAVEFNVGHAERRPELPSGSCTLVGAGAWCEH